MKVTLLGPRVHFNLSSSVHFEGFTLDTEDIPFCLFRGVAALVGLLANPREVAYVR